MRHHQLLKLLIKEDRKVKSDSLRWEKNCVMVSHILHYSSQYSITHHSTKIAHPLGLESTTSGHKS